MLFEQLHVEDEDIQEVWDNIVHSALLRKLILTAASSTIVGHAAKFLCVLNKDAANQGDFKKLFVVSDGQFPEVARARMTAQVANDELESLIGLYRKQLGRWNLEFMSVSGTTHLIENYVRPGFVNDDEPTQIHIDSGRHPVLESILQDSFIPNDTYLHANGAYCRIVTGPNMGGKSCYIRQVALVAIMAQDFHGGFFGGSKNGRMEAKFEMD